MYAHTYVRNSFLPNAYSYFELSIKEVTLKSRVQFGS